MSNERTLPEFPALSAVTDSDLFCGCQEDLGHWTGSQIKTYAANAAPVQSVNTQTGAVSLDTDDVAEGVTNLYFTNARADARITAQKDVANGLATLDASVLVPVAQIPALPQSNITNLVSDLALKAPLASPTLTGIPTTPTAALSTNTTQIASTAFVQAQIANSISVSRPFRGQYDASSNLFPSTGGSGMGGAIQAGDNWIISVGGTLGGQPVATGDSIIAIVDTPGQTSANWQIINQGIGYTPENVANKSTDGTMAANSATLYPSQSAAKTYSDSKVADAITDGVTTIAPSQNAVYDALAGKEPTITTLSIAKGGTNSGTALNNNRVIVSSGGSIVETAAITASRALASNVNGIPVASATTATELGYVNGVTSAIQTQLNGKEPTITTLSIAKGGTNSGTSLNNNRLMRSSGGSIVEASAITASRALASDANGIPVASNTTTTQLNLLSSITGAVPNYSQTPVSLTMTGAVPSTTVVAVFLVIGGMVFMTFTDTYVTATSNSVLTITGFPGSGILPTRAVRGTIGARNGGSFFVAPFYLSNTGTMTVYNANNNFFSGNFTSGQTVGILYTLLSWSNVYP